MRVETLGDGEPELAVVGAIHGDEPCGEHAIEHLIAESLVVERPVKCIIANGRALDQGVRYTDTDLNRAFPGDPKADAYEERLAAELLREFQGCTVLSMHSTQSYARPFTIVERDGRVSASLCPFLSIDAVVELNGLLPTTLAAHTDVVEVKCGLQGTTEAAQNAVQLVREFLRELDPEGLCQT